MLTKFQLLLLILLSCAHPGLAQTPTSVYKNLPVISHYMVGLSYYKSGNMEEYRINGDLVDKTIYDKYKTVNDSLDNCRPCILRFYNINDTLLKEGIYCTDCAVGYLREFYPNGNIKREGQYKENGTGNWRDIDARGYCSVKEGDWKYYDETGKLAYTETWKNDQFIRQSPLQKKAEIWKYELLWNGQPPGKKQLLPSQVPVLQLKSYYKNTAREGINLSIRFRVSAPDHKIIEKTFTLDNFKTIDVMQMIRESGFGPGKGSYSLEVFNNGTSARYFTLDILY